MVATRLRYKFDAPGTYYLDLNKDLSRHHRKLIRQKGITTVYGGYMVDSQGNRVDLATAPNNWVSRVAINRAFRIWKKLNAMTLQQSGGTAPKYSDFKILLTGQHLTSNTVDAVDSADQPIVGSTSDWVYSELTTQDPSEDAGGVTQTPDRFNMFITGNAHIPGGGSGDIWSRIALIKSWVDSKAIPENNSGDPDYTADHNIDPLNNLFDSSDTLDNHITSYQTQGDLAPYDYDEVQGALHASAGGNNLQRVSTAITLGSGATPVQPIHGFQAICGLVQVNVTGATAMEICLDVESETEAF